MRNDLREGSVAECLKCERGAGYTTMLHRSQRLIINIYTRQIHWRGWRDVCECYFMLHKNLSQ